MVYRKLHTAAGVFLMVLALGLPAGVRAQQAGPGSSTSPIYPKYCEAKYTNAQGTEIIITVGCPNATDTCIADATGVSCGSQKNDVGGMTLVPGSCKQTFSSVSNEPSSGLGSN